jgi:hypothetical protein
MFLIVCVKRMMPQYNSQPYMAIVKCVSTISTGILKSVIVQLDDKVSGSSCPNNIEAVPFLNACGVYVVPLGDIYTRAIRFSLDYGHHDNNDTKEMRYLLHESL